MSEFELRQTYRLLIWSCRACELQAHEAMAKVLDAKFPHMQEWKAFRAIDRALLPDLERSSAPNVIQEHGRRRRRERINGVPSYMKLADQALAETGKPITTANLVENIARHRPLSGDPAKAKIVIQSSLSKDKRLKSVPWGDKRAWWYADRAVPK